MPVETISLFKALFDLVCLQHSSENLFDLGRQMAWNGVIAGYCTRYMVFIQADGVDAIFDTRTNSLRFNEGSAHVLEQVFMQKMAQADMPGARRAVGQ
jgi:hypothetical protein